MAKSKLVKANEKIAKAVVGGYRKVDNTVVGGYRKVESTVVGGYQKVEPVKQVNNKNESECGRV